MRRRDTLLVVLTVAAVAWGATPAHGQDVDDSNPHANAQASGTVPGVFEPPEDTEQADPALPVGTIAVDLLDADGRPVPHETVTLGMLVNSIAKGDSRKHVQMTTDEGGRVVFSGLETASNIAYRISSGFQGGAFAATPFQLEQAKAMHVVLHIYPVVRDLKAALIVAEAMVAAEVRDDRLQMEQQFTFYNLGRTAWQPENVTMALPGGFTAFNTQASMSDQGVDEVGGAIQLRGTFPPGRHVVGFRWQLPLSGDKDVDFTVGLPPHVALARVIMPAASNIGLMANGFPPADIRHDAQGRRFLVVERRLSPEDPKLTVLSVGIRGLPTAGPERLVASLLAALGVALGLALSFSGRSLGLSTASGARSALLDELGDLERGRLAGEVGPRTYERIRRELVDALALTLART